MTLKLSVILGAAGGVRHKRFRPWEWPGKGTALVARLSPTKSQAQLQLDDGYLLALARQGSHDAYDRLVRRYASFVRLKASSYFLVGGDSEDLIQEGLVGLYKAIRDFRPDRESSFRNFAELCITRQIITAVKTATRNKHTPLNGYVSFSATPGRRLGLRAEPRRDAPRLDRPRPGQPGHLLRGAALARRLPLDGALRARVARALASTSTATPTRTIGERLGCDCKTVDNALQRVKRKVGAHLHSRAVPELDRSYCSHALAHHRPGRPCRPDRWRHLRPQPPARPLPPRVRARARAGRPGPRRGRGEPTAAGTASSWRLPRADRRRAASASEPEDADAGRGHRPARAPTRTRPSSTPRGGQPHRVVLGRRDGDWVLAPRPRADGCAGAGARPRRARP